MKKVLDLFMDTFVPTLTSSGFCPVWDFMYQCRPSRDLEPMTVFSHIPALCDIKRGRRTFVPLQPYWLRLQWKPPHGENPKHIQQYHCEPGAMCGFSDDHEVQVPYDNIRESLKFD